MVVVAPEREHLRRFCALLPLENRAPAVIEGFQVVMLTDYFGGVIETLIPFAEKNGKTTLLALVALHHLCFTAEAEVVIAASPRDQITILPATGLVKRSELLQSATA